MIVDGKFISGYHFIEHDGVYTVNHEPQLFNTQIEIENSIYRYMYGHPMFVYETDGEVQIYPGYSWNGLTCAFDTPTALRASLIHDCLLQMISEKYLPQKFRKKADKIFKQVCKEDGVGLIRRNWLYAGVTIGRWKSNLSFKPPVKKWDAMKRKR